MNRRSFLLGGATAASYVTALHGSAVNSNGATLAVHVTYSGSGTIDESHKLYVAIWDSPDFTKEGGNSLRPIAAALIMSKSGTATFEAVEKNPVFISMAYDSTGKWADPKSDPPSGTSLGLYSKEPGVPTPVELEAGKTTKVSAELDDSYQKP
jgi:hypothetical protein